MANSNKINIEGAMLLEQSFAKVLMFFSIAGHCHLLVYKVPYEHYRKVFRTSQRLVEREMSAIQSMSNELSSQEFSRSNALDKVQNMISKAEGLKRKVSLYSYIIPPLYSLL